MLTQDESRAEVEELRVLGSCSEQGRGSSGAKRSESGRKCSHILVSGLYSETPGSKGSGGGGGVGSGSPGLGSGSIKEVCFSRKIRSCNSQSCRCCHLLMGEMRRLCVCVCVCVCTHVCMCLHVTAVRVSVGTPVCASICVVVCLCVQCLRLCLNT